MATILYPPANFKVDGASTDVDLKPVAPLVQHAGKLELHNVGGDIVTEISTDGTLGDNSPTKIPTQSAVVAYVSSGGSLPVPLTLQSATPYQLKLKQTGQAGETTLGHDGANEGVITTNQRLRLASTGVLTVDSVNDALNPTWTAASVSTKGGLAVAKQVWAKTVSAADDSGDPQVNAVYDALHWATMGADSSGYMVLRSSHGLVMVPDTIKAQFRDTTDVVSSSSAAVTMAGGLGIAKSVIADGDVSCRQLVPTASDREQLMCHYDPTHYVSILSQFDGSSYIRNSHSAPIYLGSNANQVYSQCTDDAVSLSSAAVHTDGGMAVTKSLRVGTSINAARMTSTSAAGNQLALLYDLTHGATFDATVAGNLSITPTGGTTVINGTEWIAYDGTHYGTLSSNVSGWLQLAASGPNITTDGTNVFKVLNTTDASSSTIGGATFAGGIAVAKAGNFGGLLSAPRLTLTGTTQPQFRIFYDGSHFGYIGVDANGYISVSSSNAATELGVAGYLKAVSTTTSQAQLVYDGTHYTGLTTDASGNFAITPTSNLVQTPKIQALYAAAAPQLTVGYNVPNNVQFMVGATGNLEVNMGASVNATITFNGTLDATTTTNASIMMAGGLGVAKTVVAKNVMTDLIYKEVYCPFDHVIASGGPTLAAIQTHGTAYQYPDAATTYSNFTMPLPRDRYGSTNVSVVVRWAPSTTNAGNVRWQCWYSWTNNGDQVPSAASWTQSLVTAAAGGTSNRNNETVVATFAPDASMATLVMFSLDRLGGDGADTFTGVAQVLSVSLRYQTRVRGDLV